MNLMCDGLHRLAVYKGWSDLTSPMEGGFGNQDEDRTAFTVEEHHVYRSKSMYVRRIQLARVTQIQRLPQLKHAW